MEESEDRLASFSEDVHPLSELPYYSSDAYAELELEEPDSYDEDVPLE